MKIWIFQDLLLGENGYFTRRIKYIKSRKANRQRELNATLASNHEISFDSNEISLDQQKEDLDFLKYCVIGNADENVLVERLNTTRELRRKLMSDENSDIRTNFPFFFSNPELVNTYPFN